MPPKLNFVISEVKNQMSHAKTMKELSLLMGCGETTMRLYMQENDLYDEFYGIETKSEKLKCSYCGSTTRVEKINTVPYCKKHFNHMYRYGKIIERTIYDKNEYRFNNETVEIVLRDKYQNINGICFIDKEDFDKVKDCKWYLSNGYAKTKGFEKGKTIPISDIIMNNESPYYIIDHIDNCKLNNRKMNLRKVDSHKNAINMSRKSTNVSGVPGVKFYNKRWESNLTYQYESIYLGRYDSFDEAVESRLKAEAKYFKEYSNNYNPETKTIMLTYFSRTLDEKRIIEVSLDGEILLNQYAKTI